MAGTWNEMEKGQNHIRQSIYGTGLKQQMGITWLNLHRNKRWDCKDDP